MLVTQEVDLGEEEDTMAVAITTTVDGTYIKFLIMNERFHRESEARCCSECGSACVLQ